VPLRAVGADQELSGSRGNLLVRLDLLSANASTANVKSNVANSATAAAATTASSSGATVATASAVVDPAAALVVELSSGGAGNAAAATATQEAREASEHQRALFVYTRGALFIGSGCLGLIILPSPRCSTLLLSIIRFFFHVFAGWWLEYVREQQQQQRNTLLGPNAAVSAAPVKSARLFASCESDGQRRLVCSFLHPLRYELDTVKGLLFGTVKLAAF